MQNFLDFETSNGHSSFLAQPMIKDLPMTVAAASGHVTQQSNLFRAEIIFLLHFFLLAFIS